MTFYIRTDEPEFTSTLKKELESHGFKEGTLPADFVFLSGKAAYWKNKINLKNSLLTNLIEDEPLTNKIELHKQFPKEKFIKPFEIISLNKKLEEQVSEFTGIKILKPSDGYSGRGIFIVQNKQEVLKRLRNDNTTYSEKFLLQDYVMEPALIKGHKFHLRVLVLGIDNRKFIYHLAPYYVAKAPFKQDNFLETGIHDTHWNPEFKEFYPQTLPDEWTKKVSLSFLKKVFSELELKSAWNSRNSYYLFGVDIMFDKKNPVLLEINNKIGLKDMEFIVPDLLNILLKGRLKHWKEL